MKLQNDNIWFGFLTIAKASQSAYPQMVRQQGILTDKGLQLLLTRRTNTMVRLVFGISGLPVIPSVHSILVKRLLEAAHILVKNDKDGTIIEQHLSPAHTLRLARSGFSAFTTLGLEDLIKNMISKCSTPLSFSN